MTRIVLYTTPYCGYCNAAKSLLERKGISYAEIDVSGDFAKREELAARAFGWRAVPQIFIEDRRHIGGYDELAQLEREARLDALLAESEAMSAPVP
jgi:glutaredoxin 3